MNQIQKHNYEISKPFAMFEKTYSLKNIDGLIANTYVLAIVIALIFIGISMIVANLIAYQGGVRPRDPSIRRTWFFVLSALMLVGFFLFHYLFAFSLVKGAPAQSKYLINICIATGVNLLVYIALGVLLSKFFKNSKFGTIFPSKGR